MLRAAAALLAVPAGLLAAAAALAAQPAPAAECTVTAAPAAGAPALRPEAARLDPAQAANARIIVGVAAVRALPARAAVIALATARQESGLRNLPGGDRDSVGLFQQRPS